MSKKLFREFIVILIIIGFSTSSISTSSLNIKNNTNTFNINYKSLNSKEIDINFSEPQIKYNDKYAEISLKEADSSIMNPGKPILPKYNMIMKFPLGTKIKNIQITLSDIKQITLSKSINTAPYPCIGIGKIEYLLNFFNKYLNKISGVYPKEWFDYKTGGGLDDNDRVTFLPIELYPIRYNHKSDKIEYVEKIKIKIDYIKPENLLTFPDEYDFLIIAPSEYSNDLDLFVEHKNNHNISTKLVTLEEIDGTGRDKQEKIKYFIKDAIENWGIKYVLLVGDKTRMPVRYTYPMSLLKFYERVFGKIPTDLYYADIYDSDGNFCSWDSNNDNIFGKNTFFQSDKVDLYPDVTLGRLYCSNNSEVINVVNKIISYEDGVYNKDWFNNIAICGGNTHPDWKDIYFICLYSYFKMYFGNGKIANEGQYIGNNLSDILINYNSEKYYASSSVSNHQLTCDNINNAINNGTGFVFFIGHGNSETWGTFKPGFFASDLVPYPDGYSIDQIDNLTNENKYPIIVFDACSCGDFRESDNPIAWQAVKLKSKGAIATFAATAVSFGFPGTYCEKGFNNLIDLGIAQAISDGTEKAGDLLKNSINNYLNKAVFEYPLNIFDKYIVQIQEMFGDPTLKIGGYQ